MDCRKSVNTGKEEQKRVPASSQHTSVCGHCHTRHYRDRQEGLSLQSPGGYWCVAREGLTLMTSDSGENVHRGKAQVLGKERQLPNCHLFHEALLAPAWGNSFSHSFEHPFICSLNYSASIFSKPCFFTVSGHLRLL